MFVSVCSIRRVWLSKRRVAVEYGSVLTSKSTTVAPSSLKLEVRPPLGPNRAKPSLFPETADLYIFRLLLLHDCSSLMPTPIHNSQPTVTTASEHAAHYRMAKRSPIQLRFHAPCAGPASSTNQVGATFPKVRCNSLPLPGNKPLLW